MDAARRRLRVVSGHFQPHADATGGLDANPTAGEYAHGNLLSSPLPFPPCPLTCISRLDLPSDAPRFGFRVRFVNTTVLITL
jgi:hypothetical protein